MLATLKPSKIVSSDLQRARQTAQALADQTGLPVHIDSELRETFAGQWEGLGREELQAEFGISPSGLIAHPAFTATP